MTNMNRALACAARGWLVFPSEGKLPKVKWSTESTTDVAQIMTWWNQWPDADVCIKTGAESDLVVIDWDRYKIESSLAQNPLGDLLPMTLTIETKKGGYHYYLRHPGYPVANSAGTLAEYVDVRGDGGMVVYYGNGDEWEPMEGMPVVPDTLAARRREREVAPPEAITEWEGDDDGTDVAVQALMAAVDAIIDAPPGTRNPTLFQEAADVFKLVAGGELAESVALSALDTAGRVSGLPADEVYATVMSARKRGFEEPFSPSKVLTLRNEPVSDDYEPITLPDSYGDDEWGGCNDIANALRLADRFEYDLRYSNSHGWLRYQGGRLQMVGGLPMDEAAALPGLVRNSMKHAKTADELKALEKWTEKSSSAAKMRDALAIMQDLPLIRVKAEHLDSNPLELNTPVGVYDLSDGSRRFSTAKDLMTRITNTSPAPGAPNWERFLTQVLPSPSLRAFVQRAVGYSLTGLTREEVFFILYGSGQNGKSKFMEAIARALGNYAHTFESKLLLTTSQQEHSTNIAALAGVRFAFSSEIDHGSKLDEGKVKSLTGGDDVTARFMRRDNFTFRPTHKLWLATNYLPVITGTDRGMWRRVIVVPFGVDIPDEQRDIYLSQKLEAEAAGILAWCIDGANDYLQYGLGLSQEVVQATAAYRQSEDYIAQFVSDCTVPNADGYAFSADLYAAYQVWARDNGTKAISSIALAKELSRLGYEPDTRGANKGVRLGLTLKGIRV